MNDDRELSADAQAILKLLRARRDANDFAPTIREMMKVLDTKSERRVLAALTSLQQTGHIRREPGKPRAIALRTG